MPDSSASDAASGSLRRTSATAWNFDTFRSVPLPSADTLLFPCRGRQKDLRSGRRHSFPTAIADSRPTWLICQRRRTPSIHASVSHDMSARCRTYSEIVRQPRIRRRHHTSYLCIMTLKKNCCRMKKNIHRKKLFHSTDRMHSDGDFSHVPQVFLYSETNMLRIPFLLNFPYIFCIRLNTAA